MRPKNERRENPAVVAVAVAVASVVVEAVAGKVAEDETAGVAAAERAVAAGHAVGKTSSG